jgi:hypothetical protein
MTTTVPAHVKAICYTVVKFSDLAEAKHLFPGVSQITVRILRELGEEAVKNNGGRSLTADDLADIIGGTSERINENIHKLPGLLAYYTPTHRITVVREETVALRHHRKVNTYAYRLAYNQPLPI